MVPEIFNRVARASIKGYCITKMTRKCNQYLEVSCQVHFIIDPKFPVMRDNEDPSNERLWPSRPTFIPPMFDLLYKECQDSF